MDQRWRGRACKVYTRVGGEWKMIAQTGLLDYEFRAGESDAGKHRP